MVGAVAGTLGAGVGAAAGYHAAYKAGLNPWTGSVKESVMIGSPQFRVDKLANDFNSETITKSNSNRFPIWPKELKAYLGRDILNPEALKFNSEWINQVINENMTIFDAGRTGYSDFYNGIELNTIINRNYQNVIQLNTYSFFNNHIRISTWKN